VDEQTGNLLTNTKDLITTHQRAASLVDATALSRTLMDELAPQTAYEHLLASNIIELELGLLIFTQN
jgi:hypothetical protein